MEEFVKIVELHDCPTPDKIYYDKDNNVVESADGVTVVFLNPRHKGTIWKCSCDKRWIWSGKVWNEENWSSFTINGSTLNGSGNYIDC